MRKDLTKTTDAATLTLNKCNELLQRAQSGDTTVLPDLRRLLNESPERWKALGNMAMQAWRSWADLASGNNEVIREALLQQMESLTLELSESSQTTLERLLITRVVLCWVQIHHSDMMCAQTTKVTSQQGEYFQRRQDRAHRRYLSAIRSLAAVRRLQLPAAVQMNIGGQHVNLLGTKP